MASISSRILRAPRSEQIAEPAAPAMISAAAMGAASRTDGEHRGGARERLGAELAGQVAHLERDDRAEGDRDQDRRHQRDAGDEPRLLEELAELERAREDPLGDLDDHRGDLTGSTEDRHSSERHRSPPRSSRRPPQNRTCSRFGQRGSSAPVAPNPSWGPSTSRPTAKRRTRYPVEPRMRNVGVLALPMWQSAQATCGRPSARPARPRGGPAARLRRRPQRRPRVLAEAFADGRLDREEYDERTAATLRPRDPRRAAGAGRRPGAEPAAAAGQGAAARPMSDASSRSGPRRSGAASAARRWSAS